MKKFVSLLVASLISVSLFSGCSSSNSTPDKNRLEKIMEAGKIVVATSPDYAPYEFIDPNKTGQDSVVGCDVEFAKYIAEKLGVELVIEQMNFDATLLSVQEGKADLVISGLAYKEDRAQIMALSDDYNKGGYQGILILKSDVDNLKTAEDFAGKLIAAQTSSLQYENLISQLPDANVEPITSVPDGIMMLRSGKVDAVSMSGTAGDQYALNYDDIAMSEFRFETSDKGSVIGMMKGETELLAKINEIVKEVEDTGLYATWKEEAIILSNTLSINN